METRLPPLMFSWFLFSLSLFLGTSAQRSTYIVHLDKSFMPKIFATHQNWHSSIIDTIKIDVSTIPNDHHLTPKLLYSYDNVIHGFSAVLSKDELEALKKSPGFLSAYKDRTVEAHTTHTSEFLKLNPASGLWPASGFGQDVIIGVLDSGICPESASFRDDGLSEIPKKWKGICKPGTKFNSSLCNRKLIGANYFNKGLLANDPSVNISMNSARDTDGHGTHVASIAAGSFAKGVSYFGYAPGTARGIAPRSRIAVYKFSFEEGTFTSDLIAAMDQAVADGVDILTISYGWSNIPLYKDSIAIASFGAMMKGVLVTASAGNNGPEMGTLTNGVPWIFTVASCSTDRSFSGTLTLGNGLKITGFSLFPVRTMIKDFHLVYNGSLSTCDSSDLLSQIPNAERSIMICYSTAQEDLSVSDQMGAISESKFGAAIYVYEDPDVLASTFFPNPGVVISSKEWKQVIDYATKSVKPKASISFQETHIDVKPAPVVSAFSSRGPSASYLRVAKPDIMAPGELILAAWPSNISAAVIGVNTFLDSDYSLDSGTSMAAPHIAGIAAMLKGAHPEWSPSAIRSAMMTTANPLDNTDKPIKTPDYMVKSDATSLAMGAGLVDPNRAVDPGLVYDATPQDYVNLLCSMNLTVEQFKTIARSSAKHNCSNPSNHINYPSFIALFSPYGNYTWLEQKFKRTVTNVGAGAATYKVKVKAPKNSTISISPRTLVFEKKNQKQDYYLTIRNKGVAEDQAQSGSITWVEENGHHTVRSPIVVAPEIDAWT
ncbi:PREDICTED: subtilisin-like protease SBT1.9 [Nicotiana attenuata]|uniref:Subtilisin-like protease sbt1.9 n=1 Tax=Nicotiana attenuata TaxID=49451 RepID=A0A1J6I3Z0_NICAT|nr:PREDICTED: subtilisin-like protease SBT1.9 [Nicotiana attenuata]OIS99233.1 subtilisin-like protease sbt1.9 [Nicotiana attenuata]